MTATMTISLANVPQKNLDLAKGAKIGFSRAFEVGITLLLAEAGLGEYPQELQIVRKYHRCKAIIGQMQANADKLEVKNAEISTTINEY